MKKILVIDDETMILESIKIIFEDLGFDVTIHSDSEEGLRDALERDFDLVLCDMRMPGLDGAALTERLLAAKRDTSVFIITAFPNDPLVSRALKAGAAGLLKKPFEIAKILDFFNR